MDYAAKIGADVAEGQERPTAQQCGRQCETPSQKKKRNNNTKIEPKNLPTKLVRDYVDEPLKSKALALVARKAHGCPTFGARDTFAHWLWSHITYFHYLTKFPKHYLK